jgi:transcriptional regulator of arginine metabolism
MNPARAAGPARDRSLSKYDRQGAILRLVRGRELATQKELAAALQEQGYDAVQTTVSRDVSALGLVKVRGGDGRLVYAPPGTGDLARLSELGSALRRWVLSFEPSGNLLIVRAPSGFASPLAEVLDRLGPADIAGTVAGENTVFVAARDGVSGAELAETFRLHLEGEA